MILKIMAFVTENWDKIVLVVTTVTTLYQAFQIKFLQKK
ncbi:MAG: hypothetical protein [Arizlama microvirus]|nr:MAG: hypothetical protein [Arizlama microvirus]